MGNSRTIKLKITTMNSFITKILPLDKCHHFITGLLLFTVLHFINPLFAFIIVLLIAWIKELYDSFNKFSHTPDIWDAIATISGALMGVLCTL